MKTDRLPAIGYGRTEEQQMLPVRLLPTPIQVARVGCLHALKCLSVFPHMIPQ